MYAACNRETDLTVGFASAFGMGWLRFNTGGIICQDDCAAGRNVEVSETAARGGAIDSVSRGP